MARERKPITREEAKLKMAALCARSEQCPADIERKLRNYALPPAEITGIVSELTAEHFLDTHRYARSFARDKVRFAAWGRLKIRAALRAKRIPDDIIGNAFAEIDPDDYVAALKRAAKAKAATLDLSQREDRNKLFRHLQSRGFETEFILKTLRR